MARSIKDEEELRQRAAREQEMMRRLELLANRGPHHSDQPALAFGILQVLKHVVKVEDTI